MERLIHSKIAGVTYTNADGSQRQKIVTKCSLGERLRLEREPNNPYDANAIKLLRLNGEQIGYVTARLATDLAQYVDSGVQMEVRITEFTGGGEKTHGVNIEFRFEDDDYTETRLRAPGANQAYHAPPSSGAGSWVIGFALFAFIVALLIYLLSH